MDLPHGLYCAPIPSGRNPAKQVAIEMQDDSLSDVGIKEGCVVLVELSTEHIPERLTAVITDSGDLLVRFVVHSRDEFILVPANPEYPRIRCPALDILGHVHTIVSKALLFVGALFASQLLT